MEIFFTTISIAGFAVIWRNWLEHHISWKEWIKNKFGVFQKILLCGSCFTYWLSLIFITNYNPFNFLSYIIENKTVFFFMSWMSVSYLSVLLRFSYVLIQETVSEKVHKHDGHRHK